MDQTTMLTLKVLSRRDGLAGQKSTYIVEYAGKEYKVPLFAFQNDLPDDPATIVCHLSGTKLEQNIRTLYDHYYPDLTTPYIFVVKQKWTGGQNYYEVVDPRIKDGKKEKLLFAHSSRDLEKGQTITCMIEEISSSLSLRLADAHPSFVKYLSLDQIFPAADAALQRWLQTTRTRDYMTEVYERYDKEDGRWLLLFATTIERLLYDLLTTAEDDKRSLLITLCTCWLKTIEHSTFIADMSDEERTQYQGALEQSIALCEDFLDAATCDDMAAKVKEYISCLHPRYYPFRRERRIRFLACASGLEQHLIEENISSLLAGVQALGEDDCCADSTAPALTFILLRYAASVAARVTPREALDDSMQETVKSGVLALCYLTRMMYRRHDPRLACYTSQMYQLLALLDIFNAASKQTLLHKAYEALLLNDCPLAHHKWDAFPTLLAEKVYRFHEDDVPHDSATPRAYSDGNTCVTLAATQLTLAPLNTARHELKSMPLGTTLTASLCYDKKLQHIMLQNDFSNVQNIWSLIERNTFAPAKAIQEKSKVLDDGDDVDIYITDILNEETARAKAVDCDVEGEIAFNDLFFYYRPGVTLDDFLGADGSPMLFPAIYHNTDGVSTFEAREYKVDYARGVMPTTETILCCVISRRGNNCVAITAGGLFINFTTRDAAVQPICFANVYILRAKENGYGEGQFESFATETFDNKKAYSNYLKGINSYCFAEDYGTLATRTAAEEEAPASATPATAAVSAETIAMLAQLVSTWARYEQELRQRYGYLAIGAILARLISDDDQQQLCMERMKYTRLLYEFSVNSSLIDASVEQFIADSSDTHGERARVATILGRYDKPWRADSIDPALMTFLTTSATPLERELARLVISNNILQHFNNKKIRDEILKEILKILNIRYVNYGSVSIDREEGTVVEFKTTLVYPPGGNGPDLKTQTQNIMEAIGAMVNNKGGTLYIGVNDEGNVVGIDNDLKYFEKRDKETPAKARDNFKLHFNNSIKDKFAPHVTAKIEAEFEEKEGYTYFKIIVPSFPGEGGDYIRVGNSTQKIEQ